MQVCVRPILKLAATTSISNHGRGQAMSSSVGLGKVRARTLSIFTMDSSFSELEEGEILSDSGSSQGESKTGEKQRKRRQFDSQQEAWEMIDCSSGKSTKRDVAPTQRKRFLKLQRFLIRNQSKFESDLKSLPNQGSKERQKPHQDRSLKSSKVNDFKSDDLKVQFSTTGRTVFRVADESNSTSNNFPGSDSSDVVVLDEIPLPFANHPVIIPPLPAKELTSDSQPLPPLPPKELKSVSPPLPPLPEEPVLVLRPPPPLPEEPVLVLRSYPPLPEEPVLVLRPPPPLPPPRVSCSMPPRPSLLGPKYLPSQFYARGLSTTSLSHSSLEQQLSYLSEDSLSQLENFSRLRKWTCLGPASGRASPDQVQLRVMSYNVLAQNLLENHAYLYRESPAEVLPWNFRWQGIRREVQALQPDIVCLQEVQFRNPNHFVTSYSPFFSSLGYKYVLKARTGNKDDGCAIFYRSDKFRLDEVSGLEYKIDRVNLLDRDNVGLVCRLVSTACPSKQVVVANTHLLYNPRRADVRLCQTAMFLAEVDRFAMTNSGDYLPVIVAGDFNSDPTSPVYQLLYDGSYTYEGLGIGRGPRRLPKKMLPDNLGLSDACQWQVKLEQRGKADQFTTGSGTFRHNFWFDSVYPPNLQGVTTFQDAWLMVDYMMFSGGLDLVARKELPTGRDLGKAGILPSTICPSDHLPLIADFLLR